MLGGLLRMAESYGLLSGVSVGEGGLQVVSQQVTDSLNNVTVLKRVSCSAMRLHQD